MAVGYHGQVIMVFPNLDVVAVTTGRSNYALGQLADFISWSVKSDTTLPADAASAQLLANEIKDVSTEKLTAVGPTSKMADIVSGKTYRFARNLLGVKTLSLTLNDPQPHFDLEIYASDPTKSDRTLTEQIGLDGLYRKGTLNQHGIGNRFKGAPRVDAVKGTWQDETTFVISRLFLGLAIPPERWTLTFDGEKLNVRANFGQGPEISIDGETGG